MSTWLSLLTAALIIVILILILLMMMIMIIITITITATTITITTANVQHNAEMLNCTNQQQERTALCAVSLA